MSMPEATISPTILPIAAKYCSRCQRSFEGPGHMCVGCWNITNYEARTASEKPVTSERDALVAHNEMLALAGKKLNDENRRLREALEKIKRHPFSRIRAVFDKWDEAITCWQIAENALRGESK